MNNFGVKNITNSIVSAVQPKCANAREKGIRVEVDDDVECNPSESEDDNDDKSLGSFDCKSHSRPLTPTPEERMDPPSQEVGTQPLPPHNVQPEDEVTASSIVDLVVAPTCGIQAHHIVDKDGKRLAPIPEQFRAPVEDNASKLVSQIGIEVQTQLPDLSVRSKDLDTQFGRRLSGFTYKLHKQYTKLKDAIGEDYTRSHPPARVTLNQWTSLIDKWNSKKFKEQSLANVNNMIQMKTKHRCGSKSIRVMVHSSIIANGKVPNLAEFYKSIQYNSNTHEWISSESQVNYDNMIEMQAEHLSQTSAIPLTPEELLVKVLKPRPGYVKGLGMRPSFFVNTTVAPAENSDYVQRLEMQIAQQNEQIEDQGGSRGWTADGKLNKRYATSHRLLARRNLVKWASRMWSVVRHQVPAKKLPSKPRELADSLSVLTKNASLVCMVGSWPTVTGIEGKHRLYALFHEAAIPCSVLARCGNILRKMWKQVQKLYTQIPSTARKLLPTQKPWSFADDAGLAHSETTAGMPGN
ncbi:hypothetical protein TEA_019336 [Camellia sinensis var. sinensis]|uniref:Uncharacterized protein n=1 Tax=Camellia sinensis var. sinensis TaxID=542762 RepID=A0A4S4E0I6_CAMSN|nr:hypothetical protein TEA_019336 [Camellia sinensis var. sinensis]